MINPATMEAADKITRLVFEEWGDKTLGELRMEASIEETGLKYVSIREAGGRRFILIVCVAKAEAIESFSRIFEFRQSGGESKNWLDYTLADFSLDTLKGTLLAYQDVKNKLGERTAIALCIIRPDIIRLMERALELP